MSLYAIGDLHLSLGTNKQMDVFGPGWENYVDRIQKGFSFLSNDDICVLCGDLSWGMSIESCLPDFKFISELPSKKIILKGNHDYWWSTATKTKKFFKQNGIFNIDILNNNCFFYDNTAICGTRGWFFEEDMHRGDHDKKILSREVQRIEMSLKAAGDIERKICFFHYPPIYHNYICREITDLLSFYGVSDCFYGHIHAQGHKFAFEGNYGGVNYRLVSADYIKFAPVLVIK